MYLNFILIYLLVTIIIWFQDDLYMCMYTQFLDIMYEILFTFDENWFCLYLHFVNNLNNILYKVYLKYYQFTWKLYLNTSIRIFYKTVSNKFLTLSENG